MGAKNSTESNTTIEQSNQLFDKINTYLNNLYKNHINSIQKGTYCENIQLVFRDEVITNLTKDELSAINKNYSIGIKVEDSLTQSDMCNKIINYYHKKLELVNNIKELLNMISKNINNHTKLARCYSQNKNAISNIPFGKSKLWSSINSKITKDLDFLAIRTKMFEGTKHNISNNYYVNELDNSEDCIGNGGNWVEGYENLKKKGLIPDNTNDELAKYNAKYIELSNNLDNIYVESINSLNNLLGRICGEEFKEIEKNGITVKEKIYVDKPVSIDELDKIEKDTIEIIQNNIMNAEKTKLELLLFDIVGMDELKEFKRKEEELNKLKERLTQ